jgi:hypothetical protein
VSGLLARVREGERVAHRHFSRQDRLAADRSTNGVCRNVLGRLPTVDYSLGRRQLALFRKRKPKRRS